ncbi:MFS transporter [Mycolicibacterium wolinskyi]|uniref:MFS transporter n=1 Tax=Mycolicibacterium wolinskyi TaxID=59750 RepID=A0A1X2ESQ9_9MYCO|nr:MULTISPECIES: MFS transporter [Mycolicibacterium]MCV7287409.1 MFS transporter [Mycolicibacterium wolinskyi]MCV7294952.1 MFS transporter [Mycolicibacterium goodii]ORX09222.1 MFS transporter [Mycolicibacterium wolinskyi]
MTVESPTTASPWTLRVTVQLTVLAAAAFVYVTAEILPVGALPAIAADLDVSEGLVGTLMATYALVAALTTVLLVRVTSHWPRRRTLLLTLVCLTVSQIISALAPNFAVLAGGRVLCALTHGLMWSVIAPIGARLVPPSHAGRATAAVYVGTALALVVGNPLTAALSALWGWRLAVGAVAVTAFAVTLAAWATLPAMPSTQDVAAAPRKHRRNRRLITLSALTLVGVTGHFIAYTFIVVIIRDVVGVHGAHLAWLLAGYGVAGLLAMAAMARPLDHWPKASVVGCLAALAAALTALTGLAVDQRPGLATVLVGALAVVLWGAASTALPPMLQASAMRSAPDDPDGASGLYVAAFQVGIMGGALIGGGIYDHGGLAAMVGTAAALIIVAMSGVLATRGLFRVPYATSDK